MENTLAEQLFFSKIVNSLIVILLSCRNETFIVMGLIVTYVNDTMMFQVNPQGGKNSEPVVVSDKGKKAAIHFEGTVSTRYGTKATISVEYSEARISDIKTLGWDNTHRAYDSDLGMWTVDFESLNETIEGITATGRTITINEHVAKDFESTYEQYFLPQRMEDEDEETNNFDDSEHEYQVYDNNGYHVHTHDTYDEMDLDKHDEENPGQAPHSYKRVWVPEKDKVLGPNSNVDKSYGDEGESEESELVADGGVDESGGDGADKAYPTGDGEIDPREHHNAAEIAKQMHIFAEEYKRHDYPEAADESALTRWFDEIAPDIKDSAEPSAFKRMKQAVDYVTSSGTSMSTMMYAFDAIGLRYDPTIKSTFGEYGEIKPRDIEAVQDYKNHKGETLTVMEEMYNDQYVKVSIKPLSHPRQQVHSKAYLAHFLNDNGYRHI